MKTSHLAIAVTLCMILAANSVQAWWSTGHLACKSPTLIYKS